MCRDVDVSVWVCHDVLNFSLGPDMPSCVEGQAAPEALRLCRAQCGRGGELPVSQETPGHHGLFPPNSSTFARGNFACYTRLLPAGSTEFPCRLLAQLRTLLPLVTAAFLP